jgi:nitroreductase
LKSVKGKLKRLLPEKVIVGYREIKGSLIRLMVGFFSSSTFLTKLYYFIISSEMNEEMKAVLKGRYEHLLTRGISNKSSALLRRNIHRLEKGLIMMNRRRVFADAFIMETVECLSRCLTFNDFDKEELKWACDVLIEYFSVVEICGNIERAYKLFTKLRSQLEEHPSQNRCKYIPYQKKSLARCSISLDDYEALLIKRRSIRWYLDKKVSQGEIAQAVRLSLTAPSACNRQPFRYYCTTNSDEAVKIAKCAGGTSGFANNIPGIFAVIGDLSAYPFERDRHLIYIDGALASMQLMQAFEVMGVSTCPINWPDVVQADNRIRKVIDIKEWERVILLISFGYGDPNGLIPFSQKKQEVEINE